MSVFCINVSAEEAVELTPVEKSALKLRNADADGDGTYSIADVQLLLKAAAGTGEDKAEYDINSDGYTSVEDALAVLREVTGVKPLLTDAEALELFNAKLNAVKTDKPAFHGVSRMQYKSVKITQKMTATNALVGAFLGDMNYTDLEYDKYVEKMIATMQNNSNLTEKDKAEMEAMRESARTYRDPVVGERTVQANSSYDHLLYFPRERKSLSSELTLSDIKSITYYMADGIVTFTVVMSKASYTASTYPSDLYKTPYGKVFNLVDLNASEDSTLAKGEYLNGKVELKLDNDTCTIKSAAYSYDYYSEVKAPTQSMTDAKLGTITIDMTTKSSAGVQETFTF